MLTLRSALLFALLFPLLACAQPPGASDDPNDSAHTGDSAECDAPPDLADPRQAGGAPRPARALTATGTWTLDFDADAEALGMTDCSYVRTYGTLEERTDLAYLCPSCTLLTQGPGTVTDGYDTCYAQISEAEAERTEQLGLLEGDTISLYRSGGANTALQYLGEAVDGRVVWSDEAELDVGSFTLGGDLQFTEQQGSSEVDDPAGTRSEPYTCGWPRMSPGGLPTNWTAEVGTELPNARLTDVCDEAVDLWEFRGRYVVIDASSPNCGPCQIMAEQAEAWRASLEAECVHVELVTLLNESLSGINEPASAETMRDWVDTFGLTSPVLADLGFGYAVLAPTLNPDGGMSLPTIVVLDPDGIVLWIGSGFSEDEGFAEIEAVIRDHAASALP